MSGMSPFNDEKKKKYLKILGWALVVLAIIIADLAGVRLPVGIDDAPPPPIYDAVLEDDTTFTSLAIATGGDLKLASTNYPLEYGSSGYEAVYGTTDITGTGTASHGLTTVTFALCTLGEDPTAGAGDGAMCTLTVSGNVITLKEESLKPS